MHRPFSKHLGFAKAFGLLALVALFFGVLAGITPSSGLQEDNVDGEVEVREQRQHFDSRSMRMSSRGDS